MFTINNKSDYGLLILENLVQSERYVPLSHLVEKTHLPQRFIARIAADLVKNGILESREGKIGGYRLAKKLNTVTLFDFLKIFEEDLHLVKCQMEQYVCNYKTICSHNEFFRKKLTTIVAKELNKWTLEDMVKRD